MYSKRQIKVSLYRKHNTQVDNICVRAPSATQAHTTHQTTVAVYSRHH